MARISDLDRFGKRSWSQTIVLSQPLLQKSSLLAHVSAKTSSKKKFFLFLAKKDQVMEPNNCLVWAFVVINALLVHVITESWKEIKIILLLAKNEDMESNNCLLWATAVKNHFIAHVISKHRKENKYHFTVGKKFYFSVKTFKSTFLLAFWSNLSCVTREKWRLKKVLYEATWQVENSLENLR